MKKKHKNFIIHYNNYHYINSYEKKQLFQKFSKNIEYHLFQSI